MPPTLGGTPGEISFHGTETFGLLVALDILDRSYVPIGFVGDGTITLDTVGTKTGDSVSGHFEGRIGLLHTDRRVSL